MLKNQDTRASMCTTDLLLASPLELQAAYNEKMMLPDFFFRKCNLLHKYKALSGFLLYLDQASQIGAKIAEILNDPSSVLEELGTKQEEFKEKEKRVGNNLREVITQWVQSLSNRSLRTLQLQIPLSSASLTQMIMWESRPT